MKAEKSTNRKIRAAQIIIPPAAAALALTGCSDTGGGSDTDNIIDGASFTTPVTVAGLPGQASGFSSYKVFQPSLADIDGDGDLDLFAGTLTQTTSSSSGLYYSSAQKVIYFENNSTSSSIRFDQSHTAYTTLPSNSENHYSASSSFYSAFGPMFTSSGNVDPDSDTDIDLVTASTRIHNTGVLQYQGDYNTNTASGTTFTNPSFAHDMYLTYAVGLADLDGDNDLDMVLGRAKYANDKSDIIYSKNNGSGVFTDGDSTLVSETDISTMIEIPIPSFADLDNDGDQDMFVVTYDTGVINYYENTGSKTSPSFTSRTDNFNLSPPGSTKWFPAFGDMDGDGDLDAMIGTSDGKILYAENIDIE